MFSMDDRKFEENSFFDVNDCEERKTLQEMFPNRLFESTVHIMDEGGDSQLVRNKEISNYLSHNPLNELNNEDSYINELTQFRNFALQEANNNEVELVSKKDARRFTKESIASGRPRYE